MRCIYETFRRFSCLLPLIALCVSPLNGNTTKAAISDTMMQVWEAYTFQIEDSKTRVNLASVKLTVSKLVPIDGYLVGRYQIDVPLMSSKNDRGRIVLPLDMTVAKLRKAGGVLVGKAYSEVGTRKVNQIVCEISAFEKKAIKLEITTSERTLHFDSKYTMSKAGS